MAGRFDFTSPGAAFTSQLTQLLAERKAEERQHLLDSIAMRADERAERESQDQKAWREAQMGSMRQKDELERVGALTDSMRMGDDPSAMGYKPEDIELMKRYGKIKTTQTQPQPDAQTYSDTQELAPAPTPQIKTSYVGTIKEQERDRRKQALLGAASGMMHSTDRNQQQKGAMLAQMVDANNGDVPDNLIAQLLAPDVPLYQFNEQTGAVSDTGTSMPAGAHIVTKPDFSGRYTAMNRPDKNPVWVGTDPNDPTKQIYMHPETGETFTVTGQRNTGGAGGSNQSLLGIPQDAWNDLQDTAAFLSPDEYGKVQPNDMFEFRMRANRLLSSTYAKAISPKVRKMAQDYIRNPSLLSNYKGVQLTPEEDAQWRTLYDSFGGQRMREMLQKNPEQPFKQPNQGSGGVFNFLWK